MYPLVRDWHEAGVRLTRAAASPSLSNQDGALWLASTGALAMAWRKRSSAVREPALCLQSLAAHSMLPLEQVPSAAFGLVLAITGHAVGWPMPQGGAQNIARALIAYFRSLGGEILLVFACAPWMSFLPLVPYSVM